MRLEFDGAVATITNAAPDTHNAFDDAMDATLWEIPESGHVGGIKVRPAEYERRVVGFFDGALR